MPDPIVGGATRGVGDSTVIASCSKPISWKIGDGFDVTASRGPIKPHDSSMLLSSSIAGDDVVGVFDITGGGVGVREFAVVMVVSPTPLVKGWGVSKRRPPLTKTRLGFCLIIRGSW